MAKSSSTRIGKAAEDAFEDGNEAAESLNRNLAKEAGAGGVERKRGGADVKTDVQTLLKNKERELTSQFFNESKFTADAYSRFERIADADGDQATVEVLKFNDQYYFVNKSYILNKDHESGKLQFQVVSYKLNSSGEAENIDKHDLVTVNESVQLKSASSSLLSIV